jgi:hypothetical protein
MEFDFCFHCHIFYYVIHMPFCEFVTVPMQSSGVPGFFEQGNIPLASRMVCGHLIAF